MFSAILNELNSPLFSPLTDCKSRIADWLNDSSISIENKNEISELIKEKNIKELRDRFYRDLEFGTGGMRGVMGMGSNRMNRYVIRRSIQGLANYITKHCPKDTHRGVAIAYDSRNNSPLFTKETACVLAANNIPVYIFPTLQTTPALSYAIRKLNCLSGVCVTASHNPPEYNGIKIYWEDGAQIIPPQDAGILNEVFSVLSFSEAKYIDFKEAENKKLIHYINDDLLTDYFSEIKKLSLAPNITRDLNIVYTPLHGTGKIPALRALESWGFKNVFVVPEQAEPNGNFPTVKKPNPEERDALSLAIQYATNRKADCVFATDPDSDRLALAVYDPKMAKGLLSHQAQGDYVLLNGNQTGALLIDSILGLMKKSGKLESTHKIVKTIVTSDLHSRICAHYDIEIFNTLTGFKWIAGLVRSWETEGKSHKYLFGTEESFGFMPANNVRDKDAIAAICQASEMISVLKMNNKSVCEYLFDLFKIHGAWHEELINIDLYGEEGAQRIARMMLEMRTNPKQSWGGLSVNQILDYTEKSTQLKFSIPNSNVLQFLLKDGSKISMRPSGTEPKLKFYVSVCTEKPDVELAYKETLMKIELLSKEIHEFVQKNP
ncbi:phospho-sugar mutase [Fluviispira multicolorata]|uniref:Phospho-sugar mutase n=1 Tax=Fluviispira multicolorata TaxID=2654512 RepID=A0A833JBW6_9BACT|nr:phospho-sugar mutase [Fluviispira multicolorata]KAB8029798.1 phospho-sugar mutase [Fluviispira multicolorata]